MKDLILKLISEKINYYTNIAPKTKRVEKSISLFSHDVTPKNLHQFMKENNIPEGAQFEGSDNYDGGYDDFLLVWYVTENTTNADVVKFVRRNINIYIFSFICELYINNGYQLHDILSSEFTNLKRTSIYDLYLNREYDLLFKYCNACFIKTKN